MLPLPILPRRLFLLSCAGGAVLSCAHRTQSPIAPRPAPYAEWEGELAALEKRVLALGDDAAKLIDPGDRLRSRLREGLDLVARDLAFMREKARLARTKK
jgi:hypothetical protein